MSLPNLTGVGRLIDAPELRFTPSGKAVCKVRLAFNSRRKNPQTEQWEDADVYFVDGSLWDQEAENVAQSLDKGHEVLVTGRLKTRKYETKEGEKRSVTELAIDSIAPTMKYATVTVKKLDRSGGGNNGGGGSQPRQQQSGGYADDPWGSSAPAAAPAGASAGRQSSFDDQPPF